MQEFGNIATDRVTVGQLATGINPVNPIDNCSIDRALALTADLRPVKFKNWHAQQAIRPGADRYLGIAQDARTGKQPARLFSYLLKKAA